MGRITLHTNKVVDLYLEGKCNNVKFTVKGGRSMIYDYSDTEDRRTIKRLIAKPPTGCSWSSVSGKVATTTPSPHGSTATKLCGYCSGNGDLPCNIHGAVLIICHGYS